MTAVAVVVAAGKGTRLAAGSPKALVRLAGRPLLDHALARVDDAGLDSVVVAPPGHSDDFERVAAGHRVLAVVAGGATRTDSVRAGVAALPPHLDVVAVHDVARALTPPQVMIAAVARLGGGVVAAAPALPVGDTLRRVQDGRVVATVARDGVMAIQTPQAVVRDVLATALAWPGAATATDDLGVVEGARDAGLVAGDVALVPGSPFGLKITYPDDLALLEAVLAETARG